MKRILIVASWEMPHIKRLAEYICNAKCEDMKIDFLDNSYTNVDIDFIGFDQIYQVNRGHFHNFFMKIPKVRMWVTAIEQKKMLVNILSKQQYDLVNFHVLQFYTGDMVKISHRYNMKTMLTPLGSDILRLSDHALKKVSSAFEQSEYVSTSKATSFYDKLIQIFSIPESRFVDLPYGSETISAVERNYGKYSREELSEKLGIPVSSYNICCGYNAASAQRHEEIVEAIVANKSLLHEDCQLIVPLTYGGNKKDVICKIDSIIKKHDLRVVYLKEFMTSDQVSYLRLFSDLFIHIQTTDAANASIQEFILAGTQCINGVWLSYPHLEEDGMPYYSVPDLTSLPNVIKTALLNRKNKLQISDNTLDVIRNNSWDNVSKKWISFYKTV